MSGSRFLLDTNALVSLLAGDTALVGYLNTAEWGGVSSVISQREFDITIRRKVILLKNQLLSDLDHDLCGFISS
jgi:hypothetical protein